MANIDKGLKLLHYKDSLMFSEIINCSGIELKYKGKFIGESKLSDNWYVGTGKTKIICISLNGNQDVSELFEFQGYFDIVGLKIITQELNEILCVYEKLDIDYFNTSKEVFESAGSNWSDYNSEHLEIKTIDDVDVYKNNLFTKQNEFYYENGENYFGSYHQHSNGQAMSESEHIQDSVKIYRKDQNNKLFKPKLKRLKRIATDKDIAILKDKKAKGYVSIKTPGRRGEEGEGTAGGTGGGGTGGY